MADALISRRDPFCDPGQNLWTRSTDVVLPWSVAAHGACVLHNQLYVLGGFSGEGGIGIQAGVYDFRSGNWSMIPPLPHPRAAMGVAIVDHTVYLIGGWAADRTVMNSIVGYRPFPED